MLVVWTNVEIIVNWKTDTKHNWNVNENTINVMQENWFHNVVSKFTAILFWLQCVKFIVYKGYLERTTQFILLAVVHCDRIIGWVHIYLHELNHESLVIVYYCNVVCELQAVYYLFEIFRGTDL